jgi:rSAM/selenodomain-associated transferase 1
MMTNGVIIFVKNPEIGKAKTRIASSVGFDKSLEIYQELLSITRDIAQKIDAKRLLYYSHFINLSDAWDNDKFDKYLQADGDLGVKMSTAFDQTLKEVDKAVIVGSDCPYITTDIINAAFQSLSSHDIVIGPTYDGGYYLLGMKKLTQELFLNITFSVDTVYDETLNRIKNLGLSYKALNKLHDIDYYEDWKAYQKYRSA